MNKRQFFNAFTTGFCSFGAIVSFSTGSPIMGIIEVVLAVANGYVAFL